jgi:cytochrome P450
MLALLLAARDEQGRRMDARQIRDEVMTIFLAGHETSANALSWTLWLLLSNPQTLARARAEVDRELAGQAPNADNVRLLTYLHQCLQEGMRLYPPAWTMVRRAIQPDVIDGWLIDPHINIAIPTHTVHRRADLWPDPDRFDPDRFTPEAIKARHRFAYFPFGGGPRLCIGQHFAMLEMLIVLARLLQGFDFTLRPNQRIATAPLITLRPKYGIWLRAHAR